VPAVPTDEGYALENRYLVERATETLCPHRTYQRLSKPTLARRVARVAAQLGPIREPLLTTAAGIIIDGYARWQVARDRHQATLPCIEQALTEEEALMEVIRHHRGSSGLNAFCRIVLALQLEPFLKGPDLQPQTTSSNLTNLRRRDVRPELAKIAGVSTGNVSKVKQLLQTVVPEVHEALMCGEIRIHRAFQWHKLSKEDQLDSLTRLLINGPIRKKLRVLVRAHRQNPKPVPGESSDIGNSVVSRLGLQDVARLSAAVLDVPGKAIVVTRALYDELLRESLG